MGYDGEGFKCYNGAPNTALRLHLEEQARLRDAIKARGYHVTWFPNGEFYMAFDERCRAVTGECKSLGAVLAGLPEVRS